MLLIKHTEQRKSRTTTLNIVMKNSDKENEIMVPTSVETILNYNKRK